MKIKKLFVFGFSILLLSACGASKSTETPMTDTQASESAVAPEQAFENMSEEQRQAYMIKLIEQEEARMKAAGEL